MTCCDPLIIQFTDQEEVAVPYSTQMRELYGDVPTVQVYHLDSGEYIRANVKVAFVGVPASEVKVYNGGPATGFVKLSK